MESACASVDPVPDLIRISNVLSAGNHGQLSDMLNPRSMMRSTENDFIQLVILMNESTITAKSSFCT